MLYSCTLMATVGVKGLIQQIQGVLDLRDNIIESCCVLTGRCGCVAASWRSFRVHTSVTSSAVAVRTLGRITTPCGGTPSESHWSGWTNTANITSKKLDTIWQVQALKCLCSCIVLCCRYQGLVQCRSTTMLSTNQLRRDFGRSNNLNTFMFANSRDFGKLFTVKHKRV